MSARWPAGFREDRAQWARVQRSPFPEVNLGGTGTVKCGLRVPPSELKRTSASHAVARSCEDWVPNPAAQVVQYVVPIADTVSASMPVRTGQDFGGMGNSRDASVRYSKGVFVPETSSSSSVPMPHLKV